MINLIMAIGINHQAGESIASLHASTWLSKNSFFVPLLSITCENAKKSEIDDKQRLFHGNAMRPNGAYFAQHERSPTHANCSF
ncbi:hypothetical protein [Methylotuvimicrobium sp. KM2]|uniref:hypothetical protein n=1 Tax=Methylotuvimicrobium sp. KM2 TaxID=3133976 RepID=UPI0031012F2A